MWFDALTNYLTGCNFPDGPRKDFWPASVHIIGPRRKRGVHTSRPRSRISSFRAGKDITWFHCVIWPCMLWSAGIPLPKQVFGHGFVTAADGQKMSKSIGNVVDPHDVLAKCSADTFRCGDEQPAWRPARALTLLPRCRAPLATSSSAAASTAPTCRTRRMR